MPSTTTHTGYTTAGTASATAQVVRRGDIFYADLSPVVGSEQGGLRPVLIIQNDVGNRYSPTVIAAAITSRMGKTKLPTHIDIMISNKPRATDQVGLAKDSVILLEQIRTLDKRRLREKMGHLDEAVMEEVNNAIAVSFGLHEGLRHTEGSHRAEATHHMDEAIHAGKTSHESPIPVQAPGRRPAVFHNPINDPRPSRDPERVEPPHTAAAVVSGDAAEGTARTTGKNGK